MSRSPLRRTLLTPPSPTFSVLLWQSPPRRGPSAAHAVVALRGEVDIAAAPQLARLREQLGPGRGPVTVVCSRVTFMDVTGLMAVLALGSPEHPVQLRAISRAVELVVTAMDDSLPLGTVVTGVRSGDDLPLRETTVLR